MLGYFTLPYDQARYRFDEVIRRHLNVDDLRQLHRQYSPPAERIERATEQDHEIYRALYSYGAEFESLYRSFVREVIPAYLGADLIVQARPNFRVQFPRNTAVWDFHRDTDAGHPPSEISVWVPLTTLHETTTLWIESIADRGDYHPIAVALGQAIVFDCAQLRHGSQVNESGMTRLSFDFRVIRRICYEDSESRSAQLAMRFVVGDYYRDLAKL